MGSHEFLQDGASLGTFIGIHSLLIGVLKDL